MEKINIIPRERSERNKNHKFRHRSFVNKRGNEKKKELQKRTYVIEQLQRSRNVGTQVLDEIAKVVPNGVYLTRLEKQDNSLNITGKSESNNHLSNMIREIERSDLFEDAILESITSNDAKSKLLSDFKMRVHIKSLISLNNTTNKGAPK